MDDLCLLLRHMDPIGLMFAQKLQKIEIVSAMISVEVQTDVLLTSGCNFLRKL